MNDGIFSWDVSEIASALKIAENDVESYFTDGRRVSFLLERRIAYEVFSVTVDVSEGAPFDILDRDGQKWEVRCVTKGGMYFCPSYMVGKGREFDEEGFLTKLKEIDGYVLCDVLKFPDVPYWIVRKQVVSDWWERGKLGKNTKIARKKARELLDDL